MGFNKDKHEEILSDLLQEEIALVEKLKGGLNSNVWKIKGKDYYIAKFYFNDNRGRLKNEFFSLQFLWSKGIRDIPRPIIYDQINNIGIYSFIEGKKLTAEEVSFSHIIAIINFLKKLKELSRENTPEYIKSASDACFSAEDIIKIIERRLNGLNSVKDNSAVYLELDLFLKEIKSKFELLRKGCYYTYLTRSQMTLSPSDFGFHNALFDKELVFLDFEYFGWDDPAKMVSDFILHPGMNLSEEAKRLFLREMMGFFQKDDSYFKSRLVMVFPFFGLIWCLIVLNEFIPEVLERRIFAGADPAGILNEQLNKAKQIFHNLDKEIKLVNSCLNMEPNKIRRLIIQTVEKGGRGHIPSALSLVEILTVLYDKILKYDPKDPKWKQRDRFVFSKGHGCLALYAVLADKGFFPMEELWKFCKSDGLLGGHPENKVPGVEVSTGSLGHGLSVGVGFALNARYEKENHRTFVVIGDGESNEGSIWEAALCAAKHKLTNLTVIIDYNKHQSSGSTAEILELEPFADKWRSFGFEVREVDGHDVGELEKVFSLLPFSRNKPNAIICHTIKGKGISFLENNLEWHHKSRLKEEELIALYKEL